jgi:uncharacterized protein (TIGR04255 family)
MSQRLPEKLGRAPIIEAAFELRFQPSKEGAADILLGLLYTKLEQYRQKVQALPVASVPRPMRESEPNLRYLATHQLSGNRTHLLIGDRVLGMTRTSYLGWRNFKEGVKAVLRAAQETDLIGKVERYSLKATNLLPSEPGQVLDALNARFEIAGRAATQYGFHFRTEFVSGELTTIVEITTNANVLVEAQSKFGMLVTLDTIRASGADAIWTEAEGRVEELHVELKELFFNLLTPATIEGLEPVYQEETNGFPF